MSRGNETPARQDGQILVLFVLALVVLIGIAGLAHRRRLGAFAQRRDQQTAADLAALAAANDYLINNNASLAIDRAPDAWPRPTATRTAPARRRSMSPSTPANGVRGHGRRRRADHRNTFVGAPRHADVDVYDDRDGPGGLPRHARTGGRRSSSRSTRSTTTARRSTRPRPTSARRTATSRRARPTSRGRTTGRATSTRPGVSDIITGRPRTIDKTISFGEYIGQHNNGNHNALYDDVDT